ALNKSNNIKVVEDRKLVASATSVEPAMIVKKGINKNGIYTWQIKLPLIATYENESRVIKQNLMVNLLVARNTSPSGIGISHFVVTLLPTETPLTTTTPETEATPPLEMRVPSSAE